MICPKCGGQSKVIESRETKNGKRRREECVLCHHRFSTLVIMKEEYKRLVESEKKLKNILNFMEDVAWKGQCRQ